MSDDRIEEGLHAYAEHVQRTATVAPARTIRERAARRRTRRAAVAAFAAVLLAGFGIGLTLGRPGNETPAVPPVSISPRVLPSSSVSSDVTRLEELGIDLNVGVLIDVADDGVDRFLEAGQGGVVDFTGTAKGDSTKMALRPAPTRARNEVWIAPPAWNECVTATSRTALTLQPCRVGDEAQTWRVVPAGDSGQFELEGRYGILHVDNGLLTGEGGRTGLQTIPFER
ncbi:hypothetical protein ACPCHT_14785 [Nucisporomicrobium flavum]|jgi:hypothetical protein|uniref:hypothetical protein n=1 Tax=Nucisporomicrobium flavum TaxID=2785915 RepID=UPI003C2B68CE